MLRWTGDAAVAEVKRRLAFRLNQVGAQATAELREALNTPFPPASRPGEFPHRRTGRLRNSVRWVPLHLPGGDYGVSLMYDAEGFYGNILVAKDRKGPAEILSSVAARMLGGTGVARA